MCTYAFLNVFGYVHVWYVYVLCAPKYMCVYVCSLHAQNISLQLHHEPTFLDYVAGGCEITMMLAIDFTSSNKIPTDPESLHYMNPNGWNLYQQVCSHGHPV